MTIFRFSHNPEITPCALEVDGEIVPYINLFEHPDGHFSLALDRPGGHSPLCGMDVATEEELERWAYFLANAMAVAAGRTSHGPNSRPHNPHGANWFFEPDQISGTPIEEALHAN